MIGLVYNECIKLANRIGIWIMVGILLLGVISMLVFTISTQVENAIPEESWKASLQEEINENQEFIDEFGSDSYYESVISENEYRISNNLPPINALPKGVWSFINENQGLIQLIGVFVIVVSATIVSTEFKQGTIKLLLIRPPSRISILLSKYITVILFAFFLLSILFISSFILGSIFLGFEETYTYIVFSNGQIYEQNPVISLLMNYLLNSTNFIMMATLAFTVSSIFRSDILSISITLIGYLMGATATAVLSIFFDWPKYLLFTNTNLSVYFSSLGPEIEGMTLNFSITILIIHWVLFLLISLISFQNKEVRTGY